MSSHHFAVPGLERDVEIYRDELGVAHVLAGPVRDAFAGQGYVTAVDRLFQLEADRRRAAGRWAELAGPQGVPSDALFRRLGIAAIARRAVAALGPPDRAVFDGYAAGVNARLAEGKTALPVELRDLHVVPEPWEPWHCWAVFLYRHVLMGSVHRNKLARTALLAAIPAKWVWRLRANFGDEVLVQPPGSRWRAEGDGPDQAWAEELRCWLGAAGPVRGDSRVAKRGDAGVSSWTAEDGGSNSWAVTGDRTASGRPLLAGDPHRSLDAPNNYHQVHITAGDPGGFDAVGLAFPGVPGFPHFGHNATVAWCVTHGNADDQDLYIERFDGERYERAPGMWEQASVRSEHVAVRGAEAVPVTITETARGSVISGGPGQGTGLAMRLAAGVGPDTTPGCLLPMLRAATTTELEESMRDWIIPSNNLLIADTSGDVRYRLRGRVPVRSPRNGWSAVPGWDSAYEWAGWVPFHAMPTGRPAEGVIVTANNRPAAAGPFLGHDYQGRWRPERILQILAASPSVGRDEVERIHADVVSLAAREFVAQLSFGRCIDPRAEELRSMLAAWNGSMDTGSVAATVYTVTRRELVADIAERIGVPQRLRMLDYELETEARARLLWHAFPVLSAQESTGPDWPRLVEAALLRTADWLTATLGPDRVAWSWGAVHATAFSHPLGCAEATPPDVAIPGDSETVRLASLTGLTLRAPVSSVARYLFDVGNWEASGWVVPHGVSGDPASPHFADQQQAWLAARLLPMRYDWQRILAHCTKTAVLTR